MHCIDPIECSNYAVEGTDEILQDVQYSGGRYFHRDRPVAGSGGSQNLPKANLAKANVSTKNLTKTKLTTEKAQGAKTELIYEQQIGRKTGEWRYERVAPSKVYGRAKLQSRFYSWKQTTFVAQTIALKWALTKLCSVPDKDTQPGQFHFMWKEFAKKDPDFE